MKGQWRSNPEDPEEPRQHLRDDSSFCQHMKMALISWRYMAGAHCQGSLIKTSLVQHGRHGFSLRINVAFCHPRQLMWAP